MQPNIIHLLLTAAEKSLSKTALIQDKTLLTYDALIFAIRKKAGYFKSKGLKKGDNVLVFVPMSIDLYVTVLALFYSGMTPVFIDEWVSIKRLSLCCQLVPCTAIITKKRFLPLTYILPGLRNIPLKIYIRKREAAPVAEPENVSSTDTALITFTTGSTGIPKAANRTHEFLYAQFDALKPLLIKQGECILNTLPIVTLLNLGLGKTTVLPCRGFKAGNPLHLVRTLEERKEIDSIITSPSIAIVLGESGTHLSRIKHMITGGGAVTPMDALALKDQFHSADITVVYGSTEAEPISHISINELSEVTPDTILNIGLPVGKHANINVNIIRLNEEVIDEATFPSLLLKNNEAGEIIVSGSHVLKTYINNPVATALNKINVNGATWHRTGDVGLMDEAGNLYLLGRCNEVINWKGKTIYPMIISVLIKQELQISDTAFVLNQKKLLVIIEEKYKLKKDQVASKLESFSISGYEFRFIKKMPRDPRHRTKIDYEKLKQQLNA